jgi:AcrR family transcriptional regulator
MSTKGLKEELSFRAYATRRGVSHAAVNKAVKTKRLQKALIRRAGKILIDPVVADREWNANTEPMQQREPESRQGGVPAGTVPPNAGKPQADLYGFEAQEAADEGQERAPAGPSLSRMRAFELGYRAQITKLELEERTGQLVRASAVAAESFRVGRNVRDALLRIPSRVTGTLMAETDPHAFEQALHNEILKALDALTNTAGGSRA